MEVKPDVRPPGATAPPAPASFLATRTGLLTLVLLCAVQFLDVVDGSIVNVALPSIQHDLSFSQQNLQWVAAGYVITYGGFLLLGGRAADLLGRRRVLVAGVLLFSACSLAAGLARSETTLIGARLAQGVGAALMAPAALSLITTSFREGVDRHKALGIWGAISGLAAAAGVFLGGVLSEGPGWRWVFFVNLPVCALILVGAFRLLSGERPHRSTSDFDVRGAILATGGMLLLVYGLIKAPDQGWGTPRTLGELATAALLLAAFVVNERRTRDPLVPLSIFRVRGLAAADATQLIAFAGFYAVFFFLTLYTQNILGWSPVQAGAAYLPVTLGLGIAATVAPRLFARFGTRPVIFVGAMVSAAGIYDLSRIPLHGSYLADLLPGLVVMSLGLGAIFVGATVAANAGVPADRAGLAAGLLNTSLQLGIAVGLAIFSALATARTNDLLAIHAARSDALVEGYARALGGAALFLVIAGLISLRTVDSPGEPAAPTTQHPPTARPERPTTPNGRSPMTYVLFVYDRPDSLATLSEATRQAIHREYEALLGSPGLAGHRLQQTGATTTLTIREDHQELRPEPVLQGSLQLTGFYLLNTDDPDDAERIAARIPAARLGGAIEVRALVSE
jgi:EmrB/QacA subfamily drug resistance transporter